MKAFLLAAGLGTRLRPLTDTMPKCLIPICGKPLMDWWLNLFSRHGVDEVLVNTHHLPEQVREFINTYNSHETGVSVYESFEPSLLGSGGTVAANRSFIGNDESFLICYADNLTDTNITSLVDFHKMHNGILTMALFRTNVPEQCGIASVDSNGRIFEFIEKPPQPKSNLANAGIYVARKGLFSFIPDNACCDFGKDVLPKITDHMFGFEIHDYLIDIGTHENLRKARLEWEHDHL